jgi:diaminopimelate epimerase
MNILFHKYHGTGNDFILIDNRSLGLDPDPRQVAFLCNRRFGIGSDGLMLLNDAPGYDFAMRYFNSDGNESTLCGNGGRCMTAFANKLGLAGLEPRFVASDGEHLSRILWKGDDRMIVTLKMKDVNVPGCPPDHSFIDTGSPHYILFVENVETMDIIKKAREIRYSERFAEEGTNVDFVEFKKDGLYVRSYERGVEDETLSCGTGVTAAALAAAIRNPDNPGTFRITTRGGELNVSFKQNQNIFTDIWLEGAVMFVYSGEIEL